VTRISKMVMDACLGVLAEEEDRYNLC
jgi:hypothetical protein